MTKAAFTHYWGERMELREAREGFSPTLELPLPEFTDTRYESVFRDAQEKLGLEGLEPKYEDGETRLIAPDGFMFRVTGAFTLWPDGNDISWGYGPPAESYDKWRNDNHEALTQLESEGLSPELAETEVATLEEDNLDTEPPDLQYFHGRSLTFSFDRVTWGKMVEAGYKNPSSSDDEPKQVEVKVSGFKTTWHEQALRYIKLPNSTSDRLLATYEYGEPGVIPCWEGSFIEGDIEHLQVELVPIEDEQGDEYLPPMRRLWVPDSVRWSAYEAHPDLIDQDGDHNNRSSFGRAMRVLGSFASALAGREGNSFDDLAARSNLAVIDNPMFAHMDIDRLASLVEEMITAVNEGPSSKGVLEEREEEAREDFEKKRRKLVIITDFDEPLHRVVSYFGESDDWLQRNARHENFLFNF